MISKNLILETERETIFLSKDFIQRFLHPQQNPAQILIMHPIPVPSQLRRGSAPLDKSPFINAVHGFNGVPGVHEIHSLPLLPFPMVSQFRHFQDARAGTA